MTHTDLRAEMICRMKRYGFTPAMCKDKSVDQLLHIAAMLVGHRRYLGVLADFCFCLHGMYQENGVLPFSNRRPLGHLSNPEWLEPRFSAQDLNFLSECGISNSASLRCAVCRREFQENVEFLMLRNGATVHEDCIP